MITALKLAAVVILVAANGFFVASEFSLVGVRRSRIAALAASGSRSAKRVLRLIDHLNVYISATQLGITLASLGLGWLGEPAIAHLLEGPLYGRVSEGALHAISFGVAFSVITFLHIVFGELAPKTLALERTERVALLIAWPMEAFYRVFYWPIRLLDWAGTKTVRLFGVHATAEHASIYTEEEIRNLIEISQKSGHLRPEERRLIHRVFEFSDTLVREAMVPRTEMAAISIDCSLQDIRDAFQKHGYSRLPVYDGPLDNVAGFIHSKDLMPFLLKPEAFRLEHVLQPPMYIVDTARLEAVLRQMQKAKSHFGFVVDEHGGIEGIITLEDLLEEIVGDISDEHDEEVNEQITKVDDCTYLLDGALAVRDLNKRLKAALPESESYITIGGFLMTEAGHVPLPGEVIEHDGLKFHVEKVERRRVLRVKLELPEKRDEMKSDDAGESASVSA